MGQFINASVNDWNKQEVEVEYVEGYEDLEEEDDIEDFDGFGIRDNGLDADTGKFLDGYALLCSSGPPFSPFC